MSFCTPSHLIHFLKSSTNMSWPLAQCISVMKESVLVTITPGNYVTKFPFPDLKKSSINIKKHVFRLSIFGNVWFRDYSVFFYWRTEGRLEHPPSYTGRAILGLTCSFRILSRCQGCFTNYLVICLYATRLLEVARVGRRGYQVSVPFLSWKTLSISINISIKLVTRSI